MKYILISFLVFLGSVTFGQPNLIIMPTDTASLDTKTVALAIVGNTTGNYAQAKTLLNWLSHQFEWTATDYKMRTVKEIMVRKGGNCFELATVYMALLKDLQLTYRPIAELNLHKLSEERGQRAALKVAESGNKMSVFGRQHNDHRWVEIFDEQTNEWLPADPTMNIIGFDQWLKARAWFGERHTLNDAFSNDILVPFGIYVVNPSNKSQMVENRTAYYLVEKLNALYSNRLTQLPSWPDWQAGITRLSAVGVKAFAGQENLHTYNSQISDLWATYQQLKQEYFQAGNK